MRGDPSLTWIDYNRDTVDLSCSGRDGFSECDDAHRLTQLRNDEDLIGLPDEPFGLFVDSLNGYVVLTHLSNGAVSVANAPPGGGDPILSDAVGNLFLSGEDGSRGAVGVAGRVPGSQNDRIYVTSRREARVQTLIVQRGRGNLPSLLPAEYFFMRGTVFPSSDGRGIAFSQDGNRAYIVNRVPAMLHIFDTSLDPLGVPRNEFISSVEICAEASNLEIVPGGRPGRPGGERARGPRLRGLLPQRADLVDRSARPGGRRHHRRRPRSPRDRGRARAQAAVREQQPRGHRGGHRPDAGVQHREPSRAAPGAAALVGR